jgi:RNA polymerase sigma-70 factor (ECF subfamily)
MDETSDEELLAGALAGDQMAFATLVTRYHAPLLGYLYRLVGGDRALAEDLVQETLLRVLRQGRHPGEFRFKPWLYTIATNLARDHFRSARARRCECWSEAEENALRRVADTTPGPEARVLAAEQGSAVRAALAELGEEYRVVVVLRIYQDFTLREIAQTLQIPLGTVKSRLSVGIHRLRDALAPIQEGVE